MWNSNHESVDLLFWSWDSQICRTAFGHTRFIRWTFHEKSDKFKFHCLILEGKSTRGLSKDGTCSSDVICISFDSLLTADRFHLTLDRDGSVGQWWQFADEWFPVPHFLLTSACQQFSWGIQIFKLCQTVSSHWERGRRAGTESPSWRQRSERLVLNDDFELYDEVPFVAQ